MNYDNQVNQERMDSDKDRIQYCEAFDTVHAPESLVRKVKNMNRQSKIKTFKARKFAYVAAAFVAIVVSSNAVTYAATGSTWVEKLTVKINGVDREVDAQHTSYVEDGVEYDEYIIEVDENEANAMSMELTDEAEKSDSAEETGRSEDATGVSENVEVVEDSLNGNFENMPHHPSVVMEEDVIYLIWGEQKIDVTTDMQDGIAEGEIVFENESYHYVVEGNAASGEYSVSFTK